MTDYKVYLAGPITGLSYGETTDWRSYVINQFEIVSPTIKGYSPMRGKKYLQTETHIAGEYDEWPLSTAKGLTVKDRFDCQTSDVVFVNLLGSERVSIGTVLEIGWASANHIPVVVVMDQQNIHNHAMIRETSSFIVDTIDRGIDVVCTILLHDYEPAHLS